VVVLGDANNDDTAGRVGEGGDVAGEVALLRVAAPVELGLEVEIECLDNVQVDERPDLLSRHRIEPATK